MIQLQDRKAAQLNALAGIATGGTPYIGQRYHNDTGFNEEMGCPPAIEAARNKALLAAWKGIERLADSC